MILVFKNKVGPGLYQAFLNQLIEELAKCPNLMLSCVCFSPCINKHLPHLRPLANFNTLLSIYSATVLTSNKIATSSSPFHRGAFFRYFASLIKGSPSSFIWRRNHCLRIWNMNKCTNARFCNGTQSLNRCPSRSWWLSSSTSKILYSI